MHTELAGLGLSGIAYVSPFVVCKPFFRRNTWYQGIAQQLCLFELRLFHPGLLFLTLSCNNLQCEIQLPCAVCHELELSILNGQIYVRFNIDKSTFSCASQMMKFLFHQGFHCFWKTRAFPVMKKVKFYTKIMGNAGMTAHPFLLSGLIAFQVRDRPTFWRL